MAASVAISTAAGAQQDQGWHSTVEASATSFFGVASQTLTAFAGGLSHKSHTYTADASFKFRYGESEDVNRVKFVNARGWLASLSVDATPEAQFSPFFSATAETSLEKRIANRESGGLGAKWVFAKTNTGVASLSVAVLGERTAALSDTAIAIERVARWSWRIKMEQRIDDRFSVTHTSFYAPILTLPSQYTVTSTTVGGFDLSKAVALTMTFTDNYDSQARTRGAIANNDGSFLFGIRGRF